MTPQQAANASLSETPQGKTRCACSPSRPHVYAGGPSAALPLQIPPVCPSSELLVPSAKLQKQAWLFPNVTLVNTFQPSFHSRHHAKKVYEGRRIV
jgi:hypothetical protein